MGCITRLTDFPKGFETSDDGTEFQGESAGLPNSVAEPG